MLDRASTDLDLELGWIGIVSHGRMSLGRRYCIDELVSDQDGSLEDCELNNVFNNVPEDVSFWRDHIQARCEDDIEDQLLNMTCILLPYHTGNVTCDVGISHQSHQHRDMVADIPTTGRVYLHRSDDDTRWGVSRYQRYQPTHCRYDVK